MAPAFCYLAANHQITERCESIKILASLTP